MTMEECPVCLETMDAPVNLPCGHGFHGACLDKLHSWNKRAKNSPLARCPMCRQVYDKNSVDISPSTRRCVWWLCCCVVPSVK